MMQSAISFIAAVVPGADCTLKHRSFFDFPTWYKYLPGITDGQGVCSPKLNHLSDIWVIVAAGIEILLRVAAIAAVAAIIYGAVTYITSQGEPDKTSQAKNTIVNATVGLAISIMAALIISFVAESIS